MANLSITTAWNETVEFVRREAGLLFPISFMLLALPGALMEVTAPTPAGPGRVEGGGLWLVFLLVSIVAGIVGNVAIAYLALKPGASVGEALRRGGARLPALLGAAILIGIAFLTLFLVAAIIIVLLVPGALGAAESGATATPAMVMAVVLAVLIWLPFAIYFGARLALLTPLGAAESGGPFQLIGRSWRLTADNVWKLVAFVILVAILVGVLTGAIKSVAGILFALVAGPLEPGSTSSWLVTVVMALVNMVVGAYLTSLIARIYAQLSGGAPERVFT